MSVTSIRSRRDDLNTVRSDAHALALPARACRSAWLLTGPPRAPDRRWHNPGSQQDQGHCASEGRWGCSTISERIDTIILMSKRFVLRANVGALGLELGSLPFPSERQALIGAGELFDKYEGRVRIEIFLNDLPPALWGPARIEKWHQAGRPLPPEESN